MRLLKYSRWDNTQNPFDLSHEDVLGEMAEELIASGDVTRALERIMQRGVRGQGGQSIEGLHDILKRLREKRQGYLDRYKLSSLMDDLKQKLQEVVNLEKEGLQQRLEEARAGKRPEGGRQKEGPRGDAEQQKIQDIDKLLRDLEEELQRMKGDSGEQGPGQEGTEEGSEPGAAGQAGQGAQGSRSGSRGKSAGQQGEPDMNRTLQDLLSRKMDFMSNLPQDMGGAVRSLSDYEFMEEEARQKFQELLELLKQRAAESYFRDVLQQMKGMTSEQTAGLKEMLRDLNQMMRDRLQGKEPRFQEFMQKWGPLFGDNPPQSLEELLQQLQGRASQLQSLMESLPEEMRKELLDTLGAALNDPELLQELAQMAGLLNYLMPSQDQQPYPFSGEESLSFGEAMRLMEELQKIADLERQLVGAQRRGEVDKIDIDKLRDVLDEDAARDLEMLKRLREELEKAGLIRQQGNKLELTPKGVRKLGQKVLGDIFNKMKQDRLGLHALNKAGILGEQNEEDTKLFEFGDPFRLNMVKTVKNSVMREGAGVPLHLLPEDFEIYRDERVTQASTVLLLDQSRSMAISGCFDAAKKVALALHTLIKGQFPWDHLYVIGFADYAWELKGEDLLKATWGGFSPGTNMQHALMLARQLLSRHRLGTRQVIMITDGEPTAHLENGVPFFSYPPSAQTIEATLKEVRKCTQEGIVINVFMLEMAYYLVHFIRQMTQINRGRAFFTTPDKLGSYVMVDYLSNKRRAAG